MRESVLDDAEIVRESWARSGESKSGQKVRLHGRGRVQRDRLMSELI